VENALVETLTTLERASGKVAIVVEAVAKPRMRHERVISPMKQALVLPIFLEYASRRR
jgi:hypothetical protein